MFTAYFDASGHPDDLDVLTVAGFVAPVDQWMHFERNWKEILNRSDFGVSGLHMKEFCHSVGEFAAWKKDEPRRRNFLTALIAIIKLRVQHSFAQSIYLPDYREVDKQYELSENYPPLAYVGGGCVGKVRAWAQRQNVPQGDIAYFFEDGDKDRGKMMEQVHRAFGVNVNFMGKKQSAAFEAADLLAYENFRADQKIFSKPGVFALEDLRKPLGKLIEIPNGENGADWGLAGKDRLLEFCLDQKIPLRK